MKKQISCLISVVILLTTATVFGTVKQTGDEIITISANTGIADAKVGIQVFAKGKDFEDLEAAKAEGKKLADLLVYQGQAVTDEAGSFTVDATLFCKSGDYDLYVGLDDGTELESETFVYISSVDYKKTANKLNFAESESEVKEIILENSYVLGLSDKDLEDIDVSGYAKVLKNTIKETPLVEENREEAWKIADKVLFVQRLNEGKIKNIYAEDDTLSGLLESDIKDWIKADFVTENLQKEFTGRLSKASATSYGKYKDAFVEAFVLATVKYPNGNDNVKNIVTAFEDELGVNVTSGTKESIWGKLAGGDYTLKEFQEDFEKYSKSNEGGSGGSSGGNGSGSTGTKKPSGITEIMTTPENVQIEQMNPLIFDDIDTVDWAKDAILYLAERQIIDGVGDNKFNPNGNVTREQFAKIVVNSFVPEVENSEFIFSDVDDNAWYAPFVKKAYHAQIVSGTGDGNFGVGQLITRQDMCVMIYRAAVASGYKFPSFNNPRKFSDDSEIADYAKDAVYALKETGAVNGINAEAFGTKENASRAQAAKIIYYIVSDIQGGAK